MKQQYDIRPVRPRRLLLHAERLNNREQHRRFMRRTAVPLAAVFCCGMAAADVAYAVFAVAPCGPGRSLPAKTWLMTAPSCSPSPAGVSDQYATDLQNGTYGTDWISFIWNPAPAAQNYVEQAGIDSLVPGTGNWLYSYNAGTLFLDGTATATEPCSNYGTGLLGNCFAVELTPSSGFDIWQIIGNSFPYTVDWRNVRIASSDGSTWTQYTPSQALAADLMDKQYWFWNGSSYQTKDDVTSGFIGALQPQESVWVQIKSGSNGLSGFKLLIPKRELNDTGITWSGNYESGNNATCVSYTDPTNGDNVVAAQDCSHGPDVTGNNDADGLAGFSYTKLDSSGQPLADQNAVYTTTPWACVQDNVTGLIWEVKTDDGLLHDKDDRYTWYNTDTDSNGGAAGEENASGDTCFGWASGNAATYCNTQAYVSRVKAATLCGASDWRMPTVKELESLVNFGRSASPIIDDSYFPNTGSLSVWSGSPVAGNSYYAWYVSFEYGNSSIFGIRSNRPAVRLVRDGQ